MISRRQFLKLETILGLTLLMTMAMTQVSASDPSNQRKILAELAQANLIFLGERHDSVVDHREQWAILQALFRKNPRIAIALEMFQRPYQFALDDYLAKKINEDQLRQKTEYDERWGFDWNFYAPILRFAQQHQLPLLAINTPTEITRKVASGGLNSLTTEEKRWIPPIQEIMTDDPGYRDYLHQIYQQHQQDAQGNSDRFDRFVEAQVLWDETMAEAIAHFALSHPDYQIVVLAGRGHIIYNYGIPERVQRRLGAVKMRSVFFGDELYPPKGDRPPVDYQWVP